MNTHPFSSFLSTFIPELERKSKQTQQAAWILETTGSEDAAELKADLETELRLMFHDPKIYQQLLAWDKEPMEPLLKRQLNVLIRTFRQHQIPKELLEAMTRKETTLAQLYNNFRAEFEGKKVSENNLREVLKQELDPKRRKQAWEAAKQIGTVLAPEILSLVKMRNQSAKALGYKNYFDMQLELQEVESEWLSRTFEHLAKQAKGAYAALDKRLEEGLCQRYRVAKEELGPWAWSEPFGQEDPLDTMELDQLVEGVDLVETCKQYYREMGFNVEPVLKKSDMYERPGKSQHAFCTNIDRKGDVRTLNNVQPTIRWLETVMHELGHAIYDLGCDAALPWLLREPPHMITTEAMALIAGRQAYRGDSLAKLVGSKNKALFKTAEESLTRRQLIFSRWVLVMTAFEQELYRDPNQDLNRLWWHLVETYQHIRAPKHREGKADWASKVHIALAPVYYYSYLLGEMFASSIQEALLEATSKRELFLPQTGQFLQSRLFAPGNRLNWKELVQHTTGAPLSAEAWLKEFAVV